jgi:ketosteroid isomerase-like protein
MAEEPTTPDLEERLRRSAEAGNRRDLDGVLSVYASDALWDNSAAGVGIFEGLEEIRGFIEDWWGSYEEFEIEAQEVRDLGSGVTFAVFHQRGRPMGSSGEVEIRSGSVGLWAGDKLVRVINYPDIDEARAAAERLAEERE